MTAENTKHPTCDQFYLGISFLLTDETVSRQAELGNASIPDVFDQCTDLICFRNVVRRAAETQKPLLRGGGTYTKHTTVLRAVFLWIT